MANEKKCPCGQTIVFVRDSLDPEKIHPLDVSSPVFEVQLIDGELKAAKGNRSVPAQPIDPPAFLVSHFRTCTKVNDFRAAKKGLEADTP